MSPSHWWTYFLGNPIEEAPGLVRIRDAFGKMFFEFHGSDTLHAITRGINYCDQALFDRSTPTHQEATHE